MRAALVWHCKQSCRSLLSDQDVLQRREGRSAEWLKVVGMLEHSLKIIQMVEGIRAEDMLAITGEQKKAKHSKRKDLPKMPRDWKERVLRRGADHRCTVYRPWSSRPQVVDLRSWSRAWICISTAAVSLSSYLGRRCRRTAGKSGESSNCSLVYYPQSWWSR